MLSFSVLMSFSDSASANNWRMFCEMVIDGNILSQRQKFRMNDLMAKYKKLCPSDTVDHP